MVGTERCDGTVRRSVHARAAHSFHATHTAVDGLASSRARACAITSQVDGLQRPLLVEKRAEVRNGLLEIPQVWPDPRGRRPRRAVKVEPLNERGRDIIKRAVRGQVVALTRIPREVKEAVGIAVVDDGAA